MSISLKRTLSHVLLVVSVFIALDDSIVLCADASPGLRPAEPSVYVVDVSSWSSKAIDDACALSCVQGWVEMGDALIVDAGRGFEGALSEVATNAHIERVSAAKSQVFLARLDDPSSAKRLPKQAKLLLGSGRYAVVLAEPGSEGSLLREKIPGIKFEAMPWGAALIQRLDRAFPGGAGAQAAGPEIVDAALQAFDLDYYTEVVTHLVDFGTRYTLTGSFPNVTNYLKGELEAMGYAVILHAYSISGLTRHNVIAEIPGDVTPEKVFIVCGHCDCTSPAPTTFAPGADDNASGAGAVIEMARVLKQYRFDSTVRFICFSGEEQGLVGSYAYVKDLQSSGELSKVQGVINMDMIAYLNTSVWDVLLEGSETASQQYLTLLANLVSEYTNLTAFVSLNPYGSDHIPFIDKNKNAVLTIEYEDWYNPNYHKTSDQVSTLTFPFAAEIIKLNLAGTVLQAGIKGGYLLEYGEGLAGSGGYVPSFAGAGSTNLGEEFSLALAEGLGGAACLLAVGTAEANFPFKGGTFFVDPSGAFFYPLLLGGPTGTPGAGDLQLQFTTPADPGMSGVSLFTQFGIWDAGAVMGVSLSNGVKATFGI